MKEHISLSKTAQGMIAAKLRDDKWFEAHRVTIVEQDSEELAFMLQRKIESIEGPVMVVGTDSIGNDHPAAEVTVFVSATEIVPTNRATQGFVTAIAAVEAAIDDIDGQDWHWMEDLRHETPKEGSGILVARTSFKACMERVSYDPEANDAEAE
jgi:hypothetical protein